MKLVRAAAQSLQRVGVGLAAQDNGDAGLEDAQARRIAGRLFEGVGAMLVESERDVEELKNMISLQTLDEDGATRLFQSAYEEALAKLNMLQDKLSG